MPVREDWIFTFSYSQTPSSNSGSTYWMAENGTIVRVPESSSSKPFELLLDSTEGLGLEGIADDLLSLEDGLLPFSGFTATVLLLVLIE